MNTVEKNQQIDLMVETLTADASKGNVDATIELLKKLVNEHDDEAKDIFDTVLKRATYQLMTQEIESLEKKYSQDNDLNSFKQAILVLTDADKMSPSTTASSTMPSPSPSGERSAFKGSVKIPAIEMLLEKIMLTESSNKKNAPPLFIHLTLNPSNPIFNESETSSEKSFSDSEESSPRNEEEDKFKNILNKFEKLSNTLKEEMAYQEKVQIALTDSLQSFVETLPWVALEKSKALANYVFKSSELNQTVTDNLTMVYQYTLANENVIMEVINQQISEITSNQLGESSDDDSDEQNMDELLKSILLDSLSPIFKITKDFLSEALSKRGIDINNIPKITPMTSEELTNRIKAEQSMQNQTQELPQQSRPNRRHRY